MLLIVLAVFSVALAFQGPVPGYLRHSGLTYAAAVAATILPALGGWAVSRRALRLIERYPEDPNRGQYAFNSAIGYLQMFLGAAHIALLLLTRWPIECGRLPIVGDWIVAPSLLTVTPFLIAVVLLWLATYPAERAVRQIALEVFLFRHRPVQPVWTLGQYLTFNFRHQVLCVLVPMVFMLAGRDLLYQNEAALQRWSGLRDMPDLMLGALTVVVAIFAPLLIRHTWITAPLSPGPLRDRLLLLGEKLRVRCREILVWKSGGLIVNAAVMGLFAPLRYVLLTDGMLANLDDRKIEAVFGHEAGHVRRWHIPYLLLFSLISGCLLQIFAIRMHGASTQTYQIGAVVLGAFMLVKWGVIFLWMSQRFERQADIFGVRALQLTGVPCNQPCFVHHFAAAGESAMPVAPKSDEAIRESANAAELPRASGRRQPICTTCAHIFSETLNEVAVLNGIAPESGSPRHGSIAGRSRFLQALARDPSALERFERTMSWVQAAIILAAIACAAWAAHEMKLWPMVRSLSERILAVR